MTSNKAVYEEKNNNIFDLVVISIVGDRDNQQDSFSYILNENEGAVIICDGMGGFNSGEEASRTAVERFISEYRFNVDDSQTVQQLKRITLSANDDVGSLKADDGKPLSAGSTLIAAVIKMNKLYWNSVGDSRIYLLRNNEFVQLTLDQNYQTVLIEKKKAGLISDEEYEKESRNGDALISYLGMNTEPLIDYNETPIILESKDLLIMMSDGLYKILSDDEIMTVMKKYSDINEAICSLELNAQQRAQEKNIIRDNMTVALIRIK